MNALRPRRPKFAQITLAAGATVASGVLTGFAADPGVKRIRTGVIGCGSVSHQYLPQLTASRFVEVVSLCDIRYQRAQQQGEKFKVRNTYPNIEAMLAGEPFEFLIVLTEMKHDRA